MAFKEFKLTNISIDNKTSVYLLTVLITLLGIFSYFSLPKEKFPEIVIPTIYIGTIYPGTSPADIENLLTRPIEKQLKSINGIKDIKSNSVQDFSTIMVEFETDQDVMEAKQKVKDAVDKARGELPRDLPTEPTVLEVNFSELPILFVNLSGNIDLIKLKEYADELQDEIESLSEITRADIVGALEREIQVNIDLYKMQIAMLTFTDIERAISAENMTISGGQIEMEGFQRAVRVKGEFVNIEELENVIIKSGKGNLSYLKDVAQIVDGYKERESYARLDNNPVITLNIIKKSGENLIEASDKIRDLVAELQKNKFPETLTVTLTGDQSTMTRNNVSNLINTIIVGFIFVVLVLMFFIGIKNAIFVALAIPLSALITFSLLPSFDFTMNMVVLFSIILSLGIVVDNAIVVVENIHRYINTTNLSIKEASKKAVGEIAMPVLTGTLTTMAPFVPLLFWGGIIGKFMFFLPATLIIVLTASMVVAFTINPVLAVSFMKAGDHKKDENKGYKGLIFSSLSFLILGIIFHIAGSVLLGNLAFSVIGLQLIGRFILLPLVHIFQEQFLPKLMSGYNATLGWVLKGKRPYGVLLTITVIFFATIGLLLVKSPKVIFFPDSEPNFIYIYTTMPIGMDLEATDSITKIIEGRVYSVIGENNPIVESVISNIAVGASDPRDQDRSISSNKSKISISFVEFKDRNGISSRDYMEKIRESVKGIPGAEILVEKEASGPPTGKPINIEISGEDFGMLIALAKNVKQNINSQQIAGIEELKSDVQLNKPELIIIVNRAKANTLGLSNAQIGMTIRTALFGKEVSKYKEDEDEYPIQIRLKEEYRSNIDQLLDMKITYRDMATGGQFRQIPISSVADIEYSYTYGGIKRKNLKRVITIYSNVLSGYNANEINKEIAASVKSIPLEEGFEISLTGEEEEQKEASDFLSKAFMIAIGLIFLILVSQFNSISKPLIILTQVVFSLIGVLLGFIIFNMDISVVLTGMGVITVAGVVVKNGIIIIDYTDILHNEGLEIRAAIIKAGATRLSPVILTAASTILGLIPLAVAMNINFYTLFTEFKPQIYFGGDTAAFWGPLAWTIIFGLSFATFLTLIVVPAMYYIVYHLKHKARSVKEKIANSK